jgi:acetoin utilization protein AcuB
MKFRNYEKMPPVGAAMTPFPHFVRVDESLEEVERLMAEHEIRHIPVQQEGRVVGMISERDLRVIARAALRPAEAQKLRARDVLTPEPYVVDFGTPLAEVVSEMAARRIGSAIVVRRGKLAGIVSVVDVCRVLASVLELYFPDARGDEIA